MACATPKITPPGAALQEPELTPAAFIAADSARLPLLSWLPAQTPKAVILALHGFNDYSNAFDSAGPAFAKHGVAVYAYDQRGFGRAPHPGQWAGTSPMIEDAAAFAMLLAKRYPRTPLYLLGDSMGGAVVLTALANKPDLPVTGAILAAPAVWGRETMPWFQRTALWIMARIAPDMKLTGQGLNIMPSDNIEMLRRLGRDPIIIKETRIGALHGLVDLMDEALAAAARLEKPALLLYGEKDEIIPMQPTHRVVSRLPNLGATQKTALYEKGYHMLLRDLQAEVVIKDIAAWIDDLARPLPSGADIHAAKHFPATP